MPYEKTFALSMDYSSLNSGETTTSENFQLHGELIPIESNGDSAAFQIRPIWAGEFCGNGQIDLGETCDGQDFGGQSCSDYGFEQGSLSCDRCQVVRTTHCSFPIAPEPESANGEGGSSFHPRPSDPENPTGPQPPPSPPISEPSIPKPIASIFPDASSQPRATPPLSSLLPDSAKPFINEQNLIPRTSPEDEFLQHLGPWRESIHSAASETGSQALLLTGVASIPILIYCWAILLGSILFIRLSYHLKRREPRK